MPRPRAALLDPLAPPERRALSGLDAASIAAMRGCARPGVVPADLQPAPGSPVAGTRTAGGCLDPRLGFARAARHFVREILRRMGRGTDPRPGASSSGSVDGAATGFRQIGGRWTRGRAESEARAERGWKVP